MNGVSLQKSLLLLLHHWQDQVPIFLVSTLSPSSNIFPRPQTNTLSCCLETRGFLNFSPQSPTPEQLEIWGCPCNKLVAPNNMHYLFPVPEIRIVGISEGAVCWTTTYFHPKQKSSLLSLCLLGYNLASLKKQRSFLDPLYLLAHNLFSSKTDFPIYHPILHVKSLLKWDWFRETFVLAS